MFWNNHDDEFIIIRASDYKRRRRGGNVCFVLYIIFTIIKITALIILGLFIFRKVSQGFYYILNQASQIFRF